MHSQWFFWDHSGFQVFKHQTPSLRWPSRRIIKSPLASQQWQATSQPTSPGDFLCGISSAAHGPPLCSSSYSQSGQSFAAWAACDTTAAHFNWLEVGTTTLVSELLNKLAVLGHLPLVSLFHVLLPGSTTKALGQGFGGNCWADVGGTFSHYNEGRRMFQPCPKCRGLMGLVSCGRLPGARIWCDWNWPREMPPVDLLLQSAVKFVPPWSALILTTDFP